MWLVRAVGSSLWLPGWQDMHGHNYWIWAPPTASCPHPCSPSSTHLLPLWNALFHLLLSLCHPSHTPALACKGQQNSLFLRTTNVQISACPCSYLTSPNVTQMCCRFATFLWCHFYSVTFLWNTGHWGPGLSPELFQVLPHLAYVTILLHCPIGEITEDYQF